MHFGYSWRSITSFIIGCDHEMLKQLQLSLDIGDISDPYTAKSLVSVSPVQTNGFWVDPTDDGT